MCLYKYIILLAFVIITNANFLYSKNYKITPNDTIIVNGGFDNLQTLSIQFVNISSDTLQFKWKKISQDVPNDWEISICDNKSCYDKLLDSGDMNPVSPNEYGLLLIHCTPLVNYGIAKVRYAVWELNSPVKKDSITFIINSIITDVPSTINSKLPIFTFENEKLVCSNLDFESIKVIDLFGREVFNVYSNLNYSFEIPNLTKSIYFIQVNTKTKIFIQKLYYLND